MSDDPWRRGRAGPRDDPAGDLDRPTVSNLNHIGAGVTRANAALVPLGGRGDLSLYGKSGTHAILDVFGYFTE